MKTIQIGGGVILVAFALILGFGILVSTLKEGDQESIFQYLTIPALMIVPGIYLILRAKVCNPPKRE